MSRRMTMAVILSATILAVATFAIIQALSRRPASGQAEAIPQAVETTVVQPAADGVSLLSIDDTVVTVKLIPELEIRLQSELEQTNVLPAQPQTNDLPANTEIIPALPPEPTPEPTAVPVFVEPTATPLPVVPAPVDPIILIPYTVQPGDILYSISVQQNSGVALMATYGIDANDIMPGNVISLPIANPAYCPGYRSYVVREGDTAYSISHRLNTTPDVLRDLNNLGADYRIDIAQVICVPGP